MTDDDRPAQEIEIGSPEYEAAIDRQLIARLDEPMTGDPETMFISHSEWRLRQREGQPEIPAGQVATPVSDPNDDGLGDAGPEPT